MRIVSCGGKVFLQFDVLKGSFSFSLQKRCGVRMPPLRACFLASVATWEKILAIDQEIMSPLSFFSLFSLSYY